MYELFVLINDKAILYKASQSKPALNRFKNVLNPTNYPSHIVACLCSIILVSINIISVMSVQRLSLEITYFIRLTLAIMRQSLLRSET